MASHTVIDNFLDKQQFDMLSKTIMGPDFPWFFQATINENDKKHTYFTHTMYDNFMSNSQHFNSFINLALLLKPKALIRIKANCYLRSAKIQTHAAHLDYEYPHKAALYSINTNNGKTILENGKEIASVANRVLLFEGSTMHSSTNCSDQKARFNINFNYL